jgi:flagellar biosynthesis protein FliR
MFPDFYNWFFVFARAGALMAVFPLFAVQSIPAPLRIGLAGLAALLIAPILPDHSAVAGSFWPLVRLLFIEVSIGLLLGFVCRMVFFSIEFAGAVVATEMGLVLSSNFNPLASAMTAVPGVILHWLGLMLLLTLDMHHWMLAAFQKSYALAPVGGLHLGEALAVDILGRTAETFRIAVQMTAPVMAVSLMVILIFSMLSRAVPQMNVFAESFPARTLAGLTVFGLTCSLMAQHMENYIRRLPEDMLRVAQMLGAG